jgi:hypothetical protein
MRSRLKEIALGLPAKTWNKIKWREGTNDWLSSRFARLRVHVASSHHQAGNRAREWLLIEWPKGRRRADQVLALDPAEQYRVPRPRRRRQIALPTRRSNFSQTATPST